MMMLTWRTWYRWDNQVWIDNDDKDYNNDEAGGNDGDDEGDNDGDNDGDDDGDGDEISPDTEKYLKVHIDEADEGKNSSS